MNRRGETLYSTRPIAFPQVEAAACFCAISMASLTWFNQPYTQQRQPTGSTGGVVNTEVQYRQHIAQEAISEP